VESEKGVLVCGDTNGVQTPNKDQAACRGSCKKKSDNENPVQRDAAEFSTHLENCVGGGEKPLKTARV